MLRGPPFSSSLIKRRAGPPELGLACGPCDHQLPSPGCLWSSCCPSFAPISIALPFTLTLVPVLTFPLTQIKSPSSPCGLGRNHSKASCLSSPGAGPQPTPSHHQQPQAARTQGGGRGAEPKPRKQDTSLLSRWSGRGPSEVPGFCSQPAKATELLLTLCGSGSVLTGCEAFVPLTAPGFHPRVYPQPCCPCPSPPEPTRTRK